MRRTGEASWCKVWRVNTVYREAEAVVNRRGATRQGNQTAVVEGPRDELYVQATKNHVPVAVLYWSPQGKWSCFIFTSKLYTVVVFVYYEGLQPVHPYNPYPYEIWARYEYFGAYMNTWIWKIIIIGGFSNQLSREKDMNIQ